MSEWTRDEALEAISDKIRSGEPVGFLEAVAAINYQATKQEHARRNVWWRRLLRRFAAKQKGGTQE